MARVIHLGAEPIGSETNHCLVKRPHVRAMFDDNTPPNTVQSDRLVFGRR